MYGNERSAIVITNAGKLDRLIDLPWLEPLYRVDACDWVVLSPEGWLAVAEGDAAPLGCVGAEASHWLLPQPAGGDRRRRPAISVDDDLRADERPNGRAEDRRGSSIAPVARSG